MSLPLVSIVIPMYNQRADFLKQCLDGAINQTYPNIEVIVSDNHSTNEAVQILKDIPKDRLRIIKPDRHLSMMDHFIFAGQAAKGDFLTFLSSDDLIYPECVAKVVEPLIENRRLSFSYCENAIIDENGKQKFIIRRLKLRSGIYPARSVAYRMYNCPEYWIIGGIMRHDVFKKVGFIKEVVLGDWLLGFQLLKYGDVAYCNEVLSAIRFHERKGETKQVYAESQVLHNIQRAERHQYIIRDKQLLAAIGLNAKQAERYRDKEILGSVIVLVRQFHKKVVDKKTVNRILDAYKENQNGFHFNFLARNFTSKRALVYTYFLGFAGRIGKILSPKKDKY